MRRLLLLTMVALLYCTSSFAQPNDGFVKAQYKLENIERYFAKNVRYPKNMLRNTREGNLVLAFRINKQGKIDSLNLEQYPDKKLSDDMIKLLLKTRSSWTPTYQEGKPIDFVYKVIVRCRFSQDFDAPHSAEELSFKQAKKKYSKQRYDKALESINRAIKENPYNHDFYRFRAEIYEALNNEKAAVLDKSIAKHLKRTIMGNVSLIASTRVRVVG